MATTKKITQLPNAAPVTGAELVPLVQAGETRKSTLSALWPDNKIVEANSTDSVGDLVYVSGYNSGGRPTVAKIDITNFYMMPAIGLIVQVIDPLTVKVLLWGLYQSLGTFVPNARYWAGGSGLITTTPPSPGFQQLIGQALDENLLLVKPSLELFRKI